jgi:hypothetical protein
MWEGILFYFLHTIIIIVIILLCFVVVFFFVDLSLRGSFLLAGSEGCSLPGCTSGRASEGTVEGGQVFFFAARTQPPVGKKPRHTAQLHTQQGEVHSRRCG